MLASSLYLTCKVASILLTWRLFKLKAVLLLKWGSSVKWWKRVSGCGGGSRGSCLSKSDSFRLHLGLNRLLMRLIIIVSLMLPDGFSRLTSGLRTSPRTGRKVPALFGNHQGMSAKTRRSLWIELWLNHVANATIHILDLVVEIVAGFTVAFVDVVAFKALRNVLQTMLVRESLRCLTTTRHPPESSSRSSRSSQLWAQARVEA